MNFHSGLVRIKKDIESNKWIDTNLVGVKKDGRLIRFLKSLLHFLCIDAFRKVRLDKVAKEFETFCTNQHSISQEDKALALGILKKFEDLSIKKKNQNAVIQARQKIYKMSSTTTRPLPKEESVEPEQPKKLSVKLDEPEVIEDDSPYVSSGSTSEKSLEITDQIDEEGEPEATSSWQAGSKSPSQSLDFGGAMFPPLSSPNDPLVPLGVSHLKFVPLNFDSMSEPTSPLSSLSFDESQEIPAGLPLGPFNKMEYIKSQVQDKITSFPTKLPIEILIPVAHAEVMQEMQPIMEKIFVSFLKTTPLLTQGDLNHAHLIEKIKLLIDENDDEKGTGNHTIANNIFNLLCVNIEASFQEFSYKKSQDSDKYNAPAFPIDSISCLDVMFNWEVSPFRFALMTPETREALSLDELPKDPDLFAFSKLWAVVYSQKNGWTTALEEKQPHEIALNELFFISKEKLKEFKSFAPQQVKVISLNPELAAALPQDVLSSSKLPSINVVTSTIYGKTNPSEEKNNSYTDKNKSLESSHESSSLDESPSVIEPLHKTPALPPNVVPIDLSSSDSDLNSIVATGSINPFTTADLMSIDPDFDFGSAESSLGESPSNDSPKQSQQKSPPEEVHPEGHVKVDLDEYLEKMKKPVPLPTELPIEITVTNGFLKKFEDLPEQQKPKIQEVIVNFLRQRSWEDLTKEECNKSNLDTLNSLLYGIGISENGLAENILEFSKKNVLAAIEKTKEVFTKDIAYSFENYSYHTVAFDFLFKWEVSPLRFTMMTSEAKEKLTLDELPEDVTLFKLSKLWEVVYSQENSWTTALEKKKPSEIALNELFFISKNKLQGFEKFTDEQLAVIYLNPELAKGFSEQQIKKLTLNQKKDFPVDLIQTQEIFNGIFKVHQFVNSKKIDDILTIKQFFTKVHWKTLSPERRKEYPVAEIDEATFDLLYSDVVVTRIKDRPIEDLQKLKQFFKKEHIEALTPEQKTALWFKE